MPERQPPQLDTVVGDQRQSSLRNLKERLSRALPRKLTADDIFISYSRWDGATYTDGLADELTKKGFSCFTDRLGTDAGKELPPTLLKEIRDCAMMVVLCTEEAKKSPFVGKEIEKFIEAKGTTKQIVPVLFSETVREATWYAQIDGIAPEIEPPAALKTGDPSDAVVNRIEKSFNYRRSKERLRRSTAGAVILLLILILAIVVAVVVTHRAVQAAKKQGENVRQLEAQQRELQGLAEDAKGRAAEAGEREVAAIVREVLAGGRELAAIVREGVAGERARKANEELLEAQRQERVARVARDRAQRQARAARRAEQSSLAANYFIQSQNSADDPRQSLLLAARAATEAPPRDPQLGIYQLRALHLSRTVPSSVINAASNIWAAIISPRQDRLMLNHGGTEISIWDTETGRHVRNIPLRAINPAFSPDSKLIVAMEAEPGTTNRFLRIWKADTGEEQHSILAPSFESDPTLSFSPDGSAVIIQSPDQSCGPQRIRTRIWNYASREISKEINCSPPVPTIESFSQSANARVPLYLAGIHVSLHAPRNWQIVANDPRQLQIKEISTGAVVRPIPLRGALQFAAFIEEAKRVIIISADEDSGQSRIQVWDIEADTGSAPVLIPQADWQIKDISEDGKRLLTVSGEQISVWDTSTGTVQATIPTGNRDHLGTTFFADDERYIVTLSRDQQSLRIWDTATSQLARPSRPISQEVAFRVTGSTIYEASADGSVRIWDLLREVNLRSSEIFTRPPAGRVYADVIFTPDRREMLTVATRPGEGAATEQSSPTPNLRAQFWDVATGATETPRTPRWDIPLPVPVSTHHLRVTLSPDDARPDERRFVTSIVQPSKFNTREIRVWNLATGSQLEDFEPLQGRFAFEAFNRDGTQLVIVRRPDATNPAGAGHWTIEHYDATSGRRLGVFEHKASDGDIQGVTRNGEFYIYGVRGNNEFTLRNINERASSLRLNFADVSLAELAVALLTQAKEVEFPSGSQDVLLKLDSNVSIRLSAETGRTVIFNQQAGLEMSAPRWDNRAFSNIWSISPDGRLIAQRAAEAEQDSLFIFDARTGFPVAEWVAPAETFRFFTFNQTGDRLISVSPTGQMRSWYIGTVRNQRISWLCMLGEALSEPQSTGRICPMGEQGLIRQPQDLLSMLQEAACSRDEDARYALRNWRPAHASPPCP